MGIPHLVRWLSHSNFHSWKMPLGKWSSNYHPSGTLVSLGVAIRWWRNDILNRCLGCTWWPWKWRSLADYWLKMTSIAYSWWILLQNGSGKTSPREPRCSKWLHRRRLEFWSPANGTDTSIKTGVFRAKKLGNTKSKSRSRKDDRPAIHYHPCLNSSFIFWSFQKATRILQALWGVTISQAFAGRRTLVDQLKKTLDQVSPTIDDIGDMDDSQDDLEEGRCPDAYLMRRPFKVRQRGGVEGAQAQAPMDVVGLSKSPFQKKTTAWTMIKLLNPIRSISDPFHWGPSFQGLTAVVSTVHPGSSDVIHPRR